MIIEVQIQNFGARRAQVHAGQSFHFQKIPGAQILIFFCENWHEASFYIKEQRQKNKFEIWLLKTTILDRQKVRFWFLKKTPPKNLSSGFALDSAL